MMPRALVGTHTTILCDMTILLRHSPCSCNRTRTHTHAGGAPDGGRGGTHMFTPMPGTGRVGGGATQTSMCALGGGNTTVSTISLGADPLGYAQQLVLGLMVAIAPAHGGAAAVVVRYCVGVLVCFVCVCQVEES
jgi:hypothetical protein